ncbi:MAG: FMN-binding negative transcriptional regulator [Rhodocyclaceae bacterium]|nr:FMN-binding negative transcriptional regulator [Rhodocyclaceae bacterium]
MYLPAHFAETRPEILLSVMATHPLAHLVVYGEGGLTADPVPLLHAPDPAPLGRLRGHLARANPLWKAAGEEGVDVLVLFQGPGAYVSPNWYPSKKEDHRAVPTWNYVTVQARGRLRAVREAGWLRSLLAEMTAAHEAGLAEPWRLEEAPADFLERMLAAVVGIEIEVKELTGKWKLSQNQPPANRAGVMAGLERLGTAEALAVAGLMRRREAGGGGPA